MTKRNMKRKFSGETKKPAEGCAGAFLYTPEGALITSIDVDGKHNDFGGATISSCAAATAIYHVEDKAGIILAEKDLIFVAETPSGYKFFVAIIPEDKVNKVKARMNTRAFDGGLSEFKKTTNFKLDWAGKIKQPGWQAKLYEFEDTKFTYTGEVSAGAVSTPKARPFPFIL